MLTQRQFLSYTNSICVVFCDGQGQSCERGAVYAGDAESDSVQYLQSAQGMHRAYAGKAYIRINMERSGCWAAHQSDQSYSRRYAVCAQGVVNQMISVFY